MAPDPTQLVGDAGLEEKVVVGHLDIGLDGFLAGESDLAAVGRQQVLGQPAASPDQEVPRAHRRVADLEVKDLRRSGRPTVFSAQACQDRLKRGAHDRFGERTWGIV